MNYTPSVSSFFSGAGLMDIGLTQAGLDIVESFEIDAKACKTYRANFGDHIKECDIATSLVTDAAETDIHCFTYPCTKYSSIADLHNTRTGDELFLHALRYLAISRPEAYIVENVPGMRAFPVVMEAMSKMPDYYINLFCPVNAKKWLPQDRKRLIIIGTKKPFSVRAPEGSKRVSLKDIIDHDDDFTIPKALVNRMGGKYRDLPIISDPDTGGIAPTCMAHYAKDRSTRVVKDKRSPLGVRPYSVREYARLQGVPDSFKFPVSNTDAYKQIGNGVPVDLARWAGSELMRYFN